MTYIGVVKLKNAKIKLVKNNITKNIQEMDLTTVVVLGLIKFTPRDQMSVIEKQIKLPQVSNSLFKPS